jgi:quinoprotein glucose dehydrogenase
MLRFATLIAFTLILSSCSRPDPRFTGWTVYNGSASGIKYSSLAQIDTANVQNLKVAWLYSSGDADTAAHSQIQTNPIVVDGILYGVSPQMKLFALDAATGVQKWSFDPYDSSNFEPNRFMFHIMINVRGVAYWSDGKGDRRIFYTAGSNTFAIDASTGKPIPSFGNGGYIDLHEGLGRDVSNLFVANTSPGMIYRNLLILGSRVDEAPPSAPGHIRAYDVITGRLVWIFHTIPGPGEFGYDTWEDPEAYKYTGGANCWSGFALDEERGILFVPTGSAAYDFYGGKRKGANLFANCLLALKASTGERIWHFQFLHHDLWDKDLPTPPVLITVKRDGRKVDAVAQSTKNGMVYVFERETGKPLFDIEEVPVDTISELEGEKVWPTQPVPKKPLPFSRQTLGRDEVNPYVDDSVRERLTEELDGFRYGNMFIPPGKTPSLVFPGFDGGGEWGGPAYDPESGILYVNANEMAWVMKMNEVKMAQARKETWGEAGSRLYSRQCAYCHGADRKGLGNSPPVLNMKSKYTKQAFTDLLNSGRRMMPAFTRLDEEEKDAIAAYLLESEKESIHPFTYMAPVDTPNFMPYRIDGYRKWLAPGGYPAIAPPWGTLNAINLNTGEFVWKVTLGEYPELTARGIAPTGTENYGGPVVTAGGLVVIAATRDSKIRAFSKKSGRLLWEHDLPAPGFATPALYELNGTQYIVIACGGGKLGTKSGDSYLAFSLRE